MASRKLIDLIPSARLAANSTIKRCKAVGVDLLIYCTKRTLEEQAILYRQSRLTADIVEKARQLDLLGYDFLAEILISVGPQPGKVGAHVTKATPGQSWHNFGMAFDAVPLDARGRALWATSNREWGVYGRCAEACGLNWGGSWRSFKDCPHSQLTHGPNPMNQYTPSIMKNILIEYGIL